MPRSVLLLLLVPAIAIAQRGPAAPAGPPAMPPEAAERYHEAARLYVDGQNAPALAAAEAAVALAPESRRAVALRDLIKEQQDQQNQQQSPQDQQNPQDQQQDQPQDPNGDDPGPPPPSGQNGPQPPEEDSPAPSDRPGEPRDGMTRDQAERILDAVGGDERDLLRRFRREPSRVRTNEQDW